MESVRTGGSGRAAKFLAAEAALIASQQEGQFPKWAVEAMR